MQLTPDMKVRSVLGMAAKLKIAATLARNADICMLDEPLNGIDLVGRIRSSRVFFVRQIRMQPF
ncbi:MAG: hypothetical protein ACLUOF_11880 [Ruminococcus sp.]